MNNIFRKHLNAMFPTLALFFLALTIGFILWDIVLVRLIMPVQKEYEYLNQTFYTEIIESKSEEADFIKLKKLDNLITFTNNGGKRLNTNVYIQRENGLFDNLSLVEHEIAVSEKMANYLGLTEGDSIAAEYPIFDEPYDYVIKNILPYASDLYNVSDNLDFAYAIVGDDDTLYKQVRGKTVYFLSPSEYVTFLEEEYSYDERYDNNNECNIIRTRLNAVYVGMFVLILVFTVITIYLAHKAIEKEVVKYYYDGFGIIAAKSLEAKDNLFSCGLPITAEIIWMTFQIKSFGKENPFCVCIIILLLFALVLSIFAGGWKYEEAH